MLKRYFVQIIVRALLMNNRPNEQAIMNYLKANEKDVYRSILLDPRFNALRVSILWSRPLTYLVFKHVLKQESFIKDYEYIPGA